MYLASASFSQRGTAATKAAESPQRPRGDSQAGLRPAVALSRKEGRKRNQDHDVADLAWPENPLAQVVSESHERIGICFFVWWEPARTGGAVQGKMGRNLALNASGAGSARGGEASHGVWKAGRGRSEGSPTAAQ